MNQLQYMTETREPVTSAMLQTEAAWQPAVYALTSMVSATSLHTMAAASIHPPENLTAAHQVTRPSATVA